MIRVFSSSRGAPFGWKLQSDALPSLLFPGFNANWGTQKINLGHSGSNREGRLDVRAVRTSKSVGAENAFTSGLSAFEVEDFHRAAISSSGGS
jgi:hypothetical protein